MDPFTHVLSGAMVSRLGLAQKIGRPATLAIVIGGILPDIDYVMRFNGLLEYLKNHRGITHSFFGGAILAAILAAAVWKWGSYKKYWHLWLLSYLGIVLHIFLDLITSYGTQIFLPFDRGRYTLDLIFIMDLPFTGIFLLGLLGSLIWQKHSRRVAWAGAVLASLYLGMAAVNHHQAEARFLRELKAQGIAATKVAVLPQPYSPFRWSAVAANNGNYYQSPIDLWESRSVKFNAPTIQTVTNNFDNKYIRKTRDLEVVRFYQWFARFPMVSYRQEGDQHIVEYFDLRFRTGLKRQPFLLSIVMDEEGDVLKQGFGRN